MTKWSAHFYGKVSEIKLCGIFEERPDGSCGRKIVDIFRGLFNFDSEKEQIGHAHLIAAAPTMLAALEEIAMQFHASSCPIDIYGVRGPKGECIKCTCHAGIAKAAIVKAKGKS